MHALHAYHPLWLRLAAEIAVGCSSDAAPLNEFIKRDLLADAALLERHQGMRTALYWTALACLVVKRLLLVIGMLDRVATTAPRGFPLLFRPKSGASSSAAVLQMAVGPLLDEADVARRLGRVGFKVTFQQSPVEEIPWEVSNMAVDLRDGLRLCRLAEELTGQPGPLATARFPAIRRSDRMHNVESALKALEAGGLGLQGGLRLRAVEVVDGDRAATTQLLWRLILQCQLPALANCADVGLEVQHLEGSAADGASYAHPHTTSHVLTAPSSSLLETAGQSAAHVTKLLHWVQTVAARYGAAVEGFGSDFADGRVLCLLVHHYMGPAHLPLARVYTPPCGAPVAHCAARCLANFELVTSAVKFLGGVPPIITGEEFSHSEGADERAVALFVAFLCHRLLETNREHRAAMVIQRRWRQRGQRRPGMAREHLHMWIAAARVVQRNVRAWLLRRGLRQFSDDRRRLERGTLQLQAAWRARPVRQEFLRTRAAVITIQAAWRRAMAQHAYFNAILAPRVLAAGLARYHALANVTQEVKEHRAATKIQAAWRTAVCRREYAHLREAAAATKLQAAWRQYTARRDFSAHRAAAVVVQKHVRRWMAVKEASSRRHALAEAKELAVQETKQRMAELAKVMAQYAQRMAAAVRIQAAWRGYTARKAYVAILAERAELKAQQAEREAAARAVIQRWIPTMHARLWFLRARRSAVVIQRSWRQELARRNAAATIIQARMRTFLAVQKLEHMKRAALVIQAAYRGHAVRAGHPQAARLHALRSRLRLAAEAAASGKHATVGVRTHEALQELQAARGRLPSVSVLQELAKCTEASETCCAMVLDTGAVLDLVRGACASGRDKSAKEPVRWALEVVGNVCSCESLAPQLVEECTAGGAIGAVVDLLAQSREKEVRHAFYSCIAFICQSTTS